ncbi:hypothetical protein SB719_21295, partial [Pantoea sp. SIMBA_079]
ESLQGVNAPIQGAVLNFVPPAARNPYHGYVASAVPARRTLPPFRRVATTPVPKAPQPTTEEAFVGEPDGARDRASSGSITSLFD